MEKERKKWRERDIYNERKFEKVRETKGREREIQIERGRERKKDSLTDRDIERDRLFRTF